MRRTIGPASVTLLCLVGMIALPLVFRSSATRSILSAGAIYILLALSYNMLYGQAGLLSFGHTIYSGLGAFCAIHLLGAINDGLPFPVSLLPLAGGLSGIFFGIIFGYISTIRGGIAFAMITLGLSELISSSGMVLPHVFGGEDGISANRVTGFSGFGITYASQLQIYYLIAAWVLLCGMAIHAFSKTPLGQISNALRDNPERVRFIGYNSHTVRFRVLLASSFFAGVAGALSALNYEIVTIDVMNPVSSGMVMLMTVIGGGGKFFGPVLGAVLLTFMQTVVANHTHAWPFYLGLLFLSVMYFLPGGLCSLSDRLSVISPQQWRERAPLYGLMLAFSLPLAMALIALVETTYSLSDGSESVRLFGASWHTTSRLAWLAIGATTIIGATLLSWCARAITKRTS